MTDQPATPNGAIEIRTTMPTTVDVTTPDPAPGVKPHLILTFYSEQLGPHKFLLGQAIQIEADFAVKLAEYIAAEGRKARSGLVLANQLPTA